MRTRQHLNSYFGFADLPLFLSLVVFGQKVHVLLLVISGRGHLVLGDDLVPARERETGEVIMHVGLQRLVYSPVSRLTEN